MSATKDIHPDEVFHTATLNSGLRVLLQKTSSSVAYAGIAVNAGSRDEESGQEGLAHFLEHMLFKGTERRKAWHILNRMESVGGDLNAFTNKQETVIYTAFLRKDIDRALDLLGDLVFNSVFPQAQIEKEREVVLEEYVSYEDSPSELIFDEFEALLYGDHPLGKKILGTPETIKSFTREAVEGFYKRHYRPDNMVLFLQGDFLMEDLLERVERLVVSQARSLKGNEDRTLPEKRKATRLQVRKNTHQAHVMIGCRCYPSNDPRKTALFLLSNILGGPGMNSRLNIKLREHRGLVYDVESNVTCYSDTGTFCIYFGCDKKDIKECIQLTMDELEEFSRNPLSPRALKAAKTQFLGQIGVSLDNRENSILEMAKFYLHHGRTSTFQESARRIEGLTSEEIKSAARELFKKDNLSLLIYK